MYKIVTGFYGLGSSVCNAIGYALVRDLTNYYWQEDEEFEKQQELNSLLEEFSTSKPNESIIDYNGNTFEITDHLLIPSIKEASSSKYLISNHNEVDDESITPPATHVIIEQTSLCLEKPNDESVHLDDELCCEKSTKSGNVKLCESLLKVDESNHRLEFTNTKNKPDNYLEKSTLEVNHNFCDEYNLEIDSTSSRDGKSDADPNNKTNNLQQIIKKSSVLKTPELGIIETFCDVESVCLDGRFLLPLTEHYLGCTKEEISTGSNASDTNECCCLHSLYFDAGDDVRNDLLSENQLQTIEKGSVSDWLYTVTSTPAVCLLQSDEILSVTQEEIKNIQEQEQIHEICKATDEIILKQSYVSQWLIDTSGYNSSKQLVGDGDFI